MDNIAPLLTPREAAERLAVHPETLRRWAREGRISAVKLPGGAVRFRPEDIAALTERAAS